MPDRCNRNIAMMIILIAIISIAGALVTLGLLLAMIAIWTVEKYEKKND